MKKILLNSIVIAIILIMYSCDNLFTCTSDYSGVIKIDGEKDGKVSLKYMGPNNRSYKKEFNFYISEIKAPYYKYFFANSICHSKDFKKNEYNFLEIKNLSSENVYICAVITGEEVDSYPNYFLYRNLLDIYNKQDKDSSYDYTRDIQYEKIKNNYLSRYNFYEQLLKENYPYIIKLEPQKTCIMKWNNLGFEVL